MKNNHVSIFILLACSVLLINRSTAQETNINSEDISILEEFIVGKSFEIVSEWAYPRGTSSVRFLSNSGLLPLGSSAGQINLIGNFNYLRMDGEKVIGYLPFYGERQIGGGYNTRNNGIQFDDIPEDLEIKEGKKGSYKIRFRIRDKNRPSESYRIFIKLLENLTTDIVITSSHRSTANYRGSISELNSDENNQ